MSRRTRRGHARGAYPRSRSMAFNGVDEYAHADAVGAAIDGFATPSSYVAWVKTSDADGSFCSAGNYAATSSERGLCITASKGEASWLKDPATGNPGCVGTTSIDDDAWHHLCATWDGTTLKVYIDGTEEDSVTPSGGDQTLAQFDIGRRVRLSTLYVAADIAEVLVFDRALSAAEVTALYGGGHWRDPRPLRPMAAFAVDHGDTMRDLGWGAAALTLVNAPTITASGPNG